MFNLFIRGLLFEMNGKTRQELLNSAGGINRFLPARELNYTWPIRDTYENVSTRINRGTRAQER
jgi:hypothetical protein